MNFHLLKIYLLSITFLITGACNVNDDPFENDIVEEGAQQYGTPFGQVPETSEIIMYEVNPLVFSPERNFKGVQNRLDEIADLGVNVLWLMPIHPIGEEKGIGSPYAVRDFYEVNSRYGTLEDLRELVSEAHARGMAVILDLVANHTAWDNEWLSTNRSWYVQDAAGVVQFPNTWQDVAELNFDNPAMRKEMIEVMKYWVLEANVDGYRCDHADGVPIDFWTDAIAQLRNLPDRDIIMFAEGGNKGLFAADFDMIFGWNFYHNLKEVFENGDSVDRIFSAQEEDYSNVPADSHFLRFTTNHDDNIYDDVPQHIFNSQEGAMAAFVITSYLGGVPMLYNGQEVGTPENIPFFYPTDYVIDWSINPQMWEEYKAVIDLRKQSAAIRNGELQALGPHSDIVAFTKSTSEEEFLVLVNVRSNAVNFSLPATVANSSWLDGYSQEPVELGEQVEMEAYSYRVFKR